MGLPRLCSKWMLLAMLATEAGSCIAAAADWPTWRGPFGTGVSIETNAPLKWSRTQNVRWRTVLPEPGNSTPIVWGDTVYLTQAIGNKRTVMALDRRTGKVRWTYGAESKVPERTQRMNPACAPSPVTDGERIIAWFGTAGLVSFDKSGKGQWRTDLGRQNHQFGYASSPVLHGNRVYLNFGPGDREFVIAVDKRSGKVLWQITAPTPGADDTYGTWSTPTVAQVDGRFQLIVALRDHLAGYDLESGTNLWFSRGLGLQAKSSPIAADGVALISGDLRGAELAVRLGGTGDVTDSHRLWREVPPRSRIGTGIARDGHIYGVQANGILDCVSLQTGDIVWAERQPGAGANSAIWSSPILVGNLLYVINQGGDTVTYRASTNFQSVAVNSLGEPCNASLALAYGDFFIRTWNALWCIRGSPAETASATASTNHSGATANPTNARPGATTRAK
ncbi:MAG: PQQ-binding-like beta-propeller repeat protein [Verrucomicrobiales bacterium]|nr:PQQ-binding-like beta-propeller repeat protein [Verrucomicrobiales bacterium]